MTAWAAWSDLFGKRLDTAVCVQSPNLSRAFIQKLCDEGKVLVNGRAKKASYKLKEGDKIKLDYDLAKLQKTPKISLPVIYEDEDCLVIDKPPGVLTHSKGNFNPEGTVATFISPRLHGMSGERAGIVHRLDRLTSGLIICAKTPEAMTWLQKQFSLRKVKKTYHAIVAGNPEPEHAIIDMPIERHPKRPQTFRAGIGGKPATTEYWVLKTFLSGKNAYSLLKLSPVTGRTHQLRVHLAQLGHPVVGDSLYGGPSSKRLRLHASALEITLPSRERRVFSLPLPVGFKDVA